MNVYASFPSHLQALHAQLFICNFFFKADDPKQGFLVLPNNTNGNEPLQGV